MVAIDGWMQSVSLKIFQTEIVKKYLLNSHENCNLLLKKPYMLTICPGIESKLNLDNLAKGYLN